MITSSSRVVIVGGSSGIGFGVARAARELGASVVLVGRSQAKLDAAREALGAPAAIEVIAADVTREEEVVRMFERIGGFDHLVVTRGVAAVSAPVEAFDMDAVRGFIETMLVSAVTLTKHARGRLRLDGSITFTSGISKDKPGPGGSVVAAVAGSFTYLARALALELGPIRVNVVSPGWVDTPMWDELAGEAKTAIWDQMAKRLPAGRIGSPADIARAYLYLMDSTFTTGTTLHIDGGHALI